MLARALGVSFGDRVELLGRGALDITDARAVAETVARYSAVINTAAYTAVDDAETHETLAFDVNALGSEFLARACADNGIRLIQVSTDYVFRGDASTPYPEDAELDPISAYGRSKAAGERVVRSAHPNGASIVRTAWLYGAGGKNFVSTMLDAARSGRPVSVVTDQIGQPTWAADVAQRIDDVLDAPVGVYHATNAGACSWHELAVEIYRSAGADAALVAPTTSADFVRPAPRPAYSVLADGAASAAGIPAMRPWQDALAEALRVDFGV
jgi:dTDP-4-dehydrorhamnose reductase